MFCFALPVPRHFPHFDNLPNGTSRISNLPFLSHSKHMFSSETASLSSNSLLSDVFNFWSVRSQAGCDLIGFAPTLSIYLFRKTFVTPNTLLLISYIPSRSQERACSPLLAPSFSHFRFPWTHHRAGCGLFCRYICRFKFCTVRPHRNMRGRCHKR